MKNSRFELIVTGGALAAALDLAYAFTFYGVRNGVGPERILQSIASGVLGKNAYAAGWPGALLGLALHFFIAIVAAFVYFEAAKQLSVLARRPWLCGAAFGVLMYGFMNLVVVPLSRFPGAQTFPALVLATGLLVHMYLVGVVIASFCRRALSEAIIRR
jgi:hypothetical protein